MTKTAKGELTLQIWERLQLVVGEDGREGVYNCRISDIVKDRLVISRPVFAYGQSLLADNRRVSVRFTRSDAAYAFRARLKETEPKSSDTMYLLDLGDISRLQRRRFVRLDKVFPVKYMLLPRPLREDIDLQDIGDSMSAVKTKNISAGGLLMEAGGEVDVGSLMVLDISGAGLKTIPRFIVAVCRRVDGTGNSERTIGLEFILRDRLKQFLKAQEMALIPDEAKQFTIHVQNDMVSDLFSEQLALRQKGLL